MTRCALLHIKVFMSAQYQPRNRRCIWRTARMLLGVAGALLATAASAAIDYRVSIDKAAGELRVAACADRDYPQLQLRAQEGATDFLLGYARSDDGALQRSGDRLIAGAVPAGACIHYRIAAARASRSNGRDEGIQTASGSWMVSAGVLLWRADEAGTVTLDLPPGMHASLPWQPRDRSRRVYVLQAGGGDWPAWAVFGAVDERIVAAGDGSELRIAVIDARSRQRADALHGWLREVASATLTAYRRFPVRSAQVLVIEISSRSKSPVPWGQTTRGAGVAVQLFVRRDATVAQLRDDWTAIHEFSHFFHPYLGNSGRWLAEGLASYYQNVLRARAGIVSEAYAWEQLDAGFGRGRNAAAGVSLAEISRAPRQRASGQRGGWPVMRIYWGGAAFWLEADIALHRERGLGLEQVLAAYSRCCLPEAGRVDPDAFIARLDALSESDVFSRLALRHATSRHFPSLNGSYAALGLRVDSDRAKLSDEAQSLALRRQIMTTPETPVTPAQLGAR